MQAVVAIGASEAVKTAISVITVYTTHYGAAKVYNVFCVPNGSIGYLQGFLTTASPWCKLTLDTMKMTENHYSSLILMGLSRLFMSALGI